MGPTEDGKGQCPVAAVGEQGISDDFDGDACGASLDQMPSAGLSNFKFHASRSVQED